VRGVEMTEYNDYLTKYEDVYLRLSDMQAEIEKCNPAPLYFESGRFGGMITKFGGIDKE